ncbi:MAG: MBL fold metallo-hydrolase [Deltaproteobacteria bacterium]
MLISILGCGGSQAKNSRTTSFLVDGKLLLDCGAATDVLTPIECGKIDNILITHPHIDHIANLPFLTELNFFIRKDPVVLHGIRDSVEYISDHLLNGKLWPDFSEIPNETDKTLSYRIIRPFERLEIGGYSVTAIPVNHTVPAVGYLIDDGRAAFAFAADSYLTDIFWERIRGEKRLKAVIMESSFPNRLEDLAKLTRHLTPSLLAREFEKLERPDVEIFATHIKPFYRKEVLGELRKLSRTLPLTALKDGMEIVL